MTKTMRTKDIILLHEAEAIIKDCFYENSFRFISGDDLKGMSYPMLEGIQEELQKGKRLGIKDDRNLEHFSSIIRYKLGKAILVLLLLTSPIFSQSKFEKLVVSQSIFAVTGALDYAIKEAPMYPEHRPDSFFWQTAWAGITYGTSFTVNLLVVKDAKYLLGCLTEDMTYYLCRKIFHKEDFPNKFGFPIIQDEVPFKTMVIIWGASLLYLLIDSLID